MKKLLAALLLVLALASPAAAEPLPFATLSDAQAVAEDVGPFGCSGDPLGRPGLAAALQGGYAIFLLANGDGTADVVVAKLNGGQPVYVWLAVADAKGKLSVIRHGKYDPAQHGNSPCAVLAPPRA